VATNVTPEYGAASYSNWDFYNKFVESDNKQGRFISSETTLIAAGFPELESIPAATEKTDVKRTVNDVTETGTQVTNQAQVYPIGLIESLGVQQSKQIQRIFEIGSARSYFIPGRVIGAFNLGRTFFNGNSLLRVLYAHVKAKFEDTEINPLLSISSTQQFGVEAATAVNPSFLGVEQFDLKRSPGFNQFFIDLTSDLFQRPFGIAVYCKDNFGNSSHAFYLENCYIQGHQVNVSSGSLLIMEGTSAQFERVAPIKMNTVTT